MLTNLRQFPELHSSEEINSILGNGSATQGEISYLSWNSKVQHILFSTSTNGTTVVWDLKKQKPLISFSDSVRRRCFVLQWNLDIATSLLLLQMKIVHLLSGCGICGT